MSYELISHSEAKAAGRIHYFTGKPCFRGHLNLRRVKGRACVDCSRDRMTRFEKKAVERDPDHRWKRRLRETYGLTTEAFERLLAEQDGRCATCPQVFGDRPNVDHCHAAGTVRGLLCGPCNRALGMVKDNPETLQRMIEYLHRHQPVRAGGSESLDAEEVT